MFLPLFCHFFFPTYSGTFQLTLEVLWGMSRALLEYLKMLTVANLSTVAAISKVECVGKQKSWNCLTSQVQRKCIRNWSLFQTERQDVADWPNWYWKTRCASAPWHLSVSRKGLAIDALQAMLLYPDFLGGLESQRYGYLPGRYHCALQSRENWAALSAGQPYRAWELPVLTSPRRVGGEAAACFRSCFLSEIEREGILG